MPIPGLIHIVANAAIGVAMLALTVAVAAVGTAVACKAPERYAGLVAKGAVVAVNCLGVANAFVLATATISNLFAGVTAFFMNAAGA